MILTDKATGTTINSWGWLNTDGQACDRNRATHRLWKCYGQSKGHFDGKVVYIAMPIETPESNILIAAVKLFGHHEFEESK